MDSFSSMTGDVSFKLPSIEQMKENAAAIRKMDYPVEIVASQQFFNSLIDFANRKPKDAGVLPSVQGLPVRVDTALAAKTAIVRYRSGKMVYLTPDGPRRTPEEEAAAMEKFMAAEPPRGLLDLFRVETIFDR